MICFGAIAPLALAADSSSKKKSSSSSARKKSSSKKSTKKSEFSQARQNKSKSASRKKGKTERRVAKAETSNAWIDDLPEVELPTLAGPTEEESIEPVAAEEDDVELDGEREAEPES